MHRRREKQFTNTMSTPRTDAAKFQSSQDPDIYNVDADFARELETELAAVTISRDEARRLAESCKALLWELDTQLAAMTAERDTWKENFIEQCSEAATLSVELEDEREKCEKLRDSADIGLGYVQECLVSHDVALGRTIERNKRDAESIEADIATIQKALEATK